ncbi:substrate-binding domain-containing protein [Burkholderia cenocepacia]|uniref:substrate-binding domain-containing protein n=1 Tax=Burkholderia cenocepacia TaxID=95486 RepID=UPI000980C960|nr:substrate-binding domain-containing protein [Burkholderia cenocepacia]
MTAQLDALEARLAQDLRWLDLPAPSWVPPREANGVRVLDVAIVGGGMAGLAASAELRLLGIDNQCVIDRAPAGYEGPWVTFARMETLRSPKQLAGPALGLPALTFRAWFEAQYGRDAWDALYKIPRPQWMDYLRWYRRVLDLQVRNDTTLVALRPRDDGLIVSTRMPDEEAGWMLDLNKPLVLLRRSPGLPIPSVGIDNRLSTYMLARHLLNLGHTRIAYLGFGTARVNDERIQGARDCLAEAGLTLDVHDAHAPTAEAGERACSRVMLGPQRPQAVICYNDLIALGFMKEAASLGFRLPQDVSVAGVDNVPYGEYAAPALTTVDIQSENMGELAMQKLIDALAGRTDASYSTFEPRLIMRASTAPAG